MVSDYELKDRAIGGSIAGKGKRIFLLASVSRPGLRPTQSPVQWLPRVLPRGRGMTLTTQPYPVPKS
jgi:hypothetical protein